VSADEFIRRYLQHALPKGFHRVRYYGLWAPANRQLPRLAREVRPLRSSRLAFGGRCP
jgi:hypothetical protein